MGSWTSEVHLKTVLRLVARMAGLSAEEREDFKRRLASGPSEDVVHRDEDPLLPEAVLTLGVFICVFFLVGLLMEGLTKAMPGRRARRREGVAAAVDAKP